MEGKAASDKSTKKITGQYAVTTVRTISWLSEPIKSKDGQKRKGRRKDVKHPIFENISKLTDEEFWKDLLMDCCFGKFPKGFDYKDGELVHKRILKLPLSDDNYEALIQAKDFFRVNGGIKSPYDAEIERLEEEQYKKDALTVDSVQWKDIRCLKMKEILLMRYISKLHHDFEKKNICYDRIKNAFILGTLTNKDVLFENGEIKTIYGLIYNKNINNYEVNPIRKYKKPKNAKLKSESDLCLKHSYMALWIKLNKPSKKELSDVADMLK